MQSFYITLERHDDGYYAVKHKARSASIPLTQLQEHVEGFIQKVSVYLWTDSQGDVNLYDLYVNEEGLLLGLSLNDIATFLTGGQHRLVGDAVLTAAFGIPMTEAEADDIITSLTPVIESYNARMEHDRGN